MVGTLKVEGMPMLRQFLGLGILYILHAKIICMQGLTFEKNIGIKCCKCMSVGGCQI